ncbi:OmpA/MotB domain protein [Brevundimonas subvibrioides ATCC 15264]|uniref:OmpA/MotB domain protein n=2 Tax=Brevundimonas subvibrioides TaxID=74313 RepID=D9QLN5_BRESC|nr:OmpA/MotB domain protein [Brevundimonas subvibrioides ATCC 15264]
MRPMRVFPALAFGLSVIVIGWPAAAQTRSVCFEPGTAQLTADAYAAVREVGLEMQTGPGRWPHAVLGGSVADDGSALDRERVDQVLLELVRVGVGVGRVKIEPIPSPSAHCVPLDVGQDDPPYYALWHFWPLFFPEGGTEVASDGARRMRFIVADYQPGQTVYRVQGYADTAGSAAASMAVSRRRADNVASELIRQGVRWDDIVVEAFGETRLARPTPDGTGEPLNRRVVVDVRSRPAASPR